MSVKLPFTEKQMLFQPSFIGTQISSKKKNKAAWTNRELAPMLSLSVLSVYLKPILYFK